MSVLALAIINKRNTPVLVRTRDQDSLGILFKLHSSLDVVDEKQSANTREPFLGILAQSDSYKIYGLCSVTQTKVLLMVSNTMVRDNEARSILRTIYNTYVDVTTNNPFYTYGHQVTSNGSLSPLSRRWNPPSNHIRSDVHDNPQSDTVIDYKVRAILNKITPEKFDKLSRELLDLGLESCDVLKRVLWLIFTKALEDSKYSFMYAKLCKVIYESLSRHYEEVNANTHNFKKLLFTKCAEEFENRRNAFELFENQTEPLSIDDEELRSIAKQKMLGNIKFICELGKQELLPTNILHNCIQQLLSKKKKRSLKDKIQDLECLCEIMKNIGYLLEEKEEARGLLDQYFERMEKYSKQSELSSRIRFMLLDVIDLRKNDWVPRQKEALPSTISDPKNDYRDNEVLQYPFPFIRQNLNLKSPRCDDVFSQINLGPYYLGTGPGVINDSSPYPNINNSFNQRRPNYQNQGYPKNPPLFGNYPNSNASQPKRDSNYNRQGGYQQQPNPNPPANMLSNGMNQLNANRDMVNLPPRFQRQFNNKQSNSNPIAGLNVGVSPFMPPIVKNESDVRQQPKSLYKNNDKEMIGKQGQNFGKPVAFNKYNNNNSLRSNMNGKDSNIVNEMNQLKLENTPLEQEPSKNVVNVILEVEKLLLEYFKDENWQEFIKNLKTINISFDETLLIIIRISIGKSETEREQAYKLINKLKQESFVNESIFLVALKNLFCKIAELEVETPRARSYVAGFVANLITECSVTLKEIGDLLDGGQHYPLFPLLLQNLNKAKGQTWLFDSFTDSKINLINMLPENDRNKERMADILEDRSLTFLYPMLRIESDITKQITSNECTPTQLYRWLKDNVNVSLQSSSEFISVVFSALLKHIIQKHNNESTPNVFSTTLFTNQENELTKYQQLLRLFLTGKPDLQLVALYSLQTYCHDINFPKGLLEKWFNMLYELEIVDDEVFFKWKEDINDEYPGKGNALFQVNKWLTWLEEADDDEDEEE
ncbi:hypothetical protein RDWZM_009625 [Blomia tropicalis]|uniref:Eukaryotic translation initiation factor 4 gamma 2 n=1 Tax=Blomia tropicalis TaxID=40697 RepID=A0A9Q0RJW1_BLOTA|nr:hypothetical protein RDWZM_009625 [Blomia tropicalis]